MRRALLLLLLVAACGPVRAADDRGDPIFTFTVDLRGEPLPEPEGELRAVFGWLSVGTGPWVSCYERTESFRECGLPSADDYETNLVLFDVPADPRFPSGLEIPFYDFPDSSELLEHDGAVLAFGGVALYDDRNLNRELDPMGVDGASSVDMLVAVSNVTSRRTLAIFQEGTKTHPLLTGLEALTSCSHPAAGYSVAEYEAGVGCEVGPDVSLLVTSADPVQIGLARCGGPIAGFRIDERAKRPPEQLPGNAVVECGAQNEIFVWLDRGSACDRYRRTRYALQSEGGVLFPWDLRDDPPDYWRCEVVRGS